MPVNCLYVSWRRSYARGHTSPEISSGVQQSRSIVCSLQVGSSCQPRAGIHPVCIATSKRVSKHEG